MVAHAPVTRGQSRVIGRPCSRSGSSPERNPFLPPTPDQGVRRKVLKSQNRYDNTVATVRPLGRLWLFLPVSAFVAIGHAVVS